LRICTFFVFNGSPVECSRCGLAKRTCLLGHSSHFSSHSSSPSNEYKFGA
jgi:hypothetical protein